MSLLRIGQYLKGERSSQCTAIDIVVSSADFKIERFLFQMAPVSTRHFTPPMGRHNSGRDHGSYTRYDDRSRRDNRYDVRITHQNE
jgi:hypothetical protein